ncbi:MAG: MarR family winged helix-turn-helix transcriptional regulator [Thermoplasmata archaeon]
MASKQVDGRARLVRSVATEFRKSLANAILFNARVAVELDLNATDLQCLHLLTLQDSATPTAVARWTGLTSGGVTVALDRLEKAGYVTRHPNPEDRRSTILRPVVARLRLLQTIYRSHGERLQTVLSGYSEQRLRQVLKFLEEVNAS